MHLHWFHWTPKKSVVQAHRCSGIGNWGTGRNSGKALRNEKKTSAPAGWGKQTGRFSQSLSPERKYQTQRFEVNDFDNVFDRPKRLDFHESGNFAFGPMRSQATEAVGSSQTQLSTVFRSADLQHSDATMVVSPAQAPAGVIGK